MAPRGFWVNRLATGDSSSERNDLTAIISWTVCPPMENGKEVIDGHGREGS